MLDASNFNPSVPIRNTIGSGQKKWPSWLKFMSHTVMTVQRISNTRMYAEATYIVHSRTQIKPRTNSKPSFWKIIPNLCHQYVLFKSNLSNPFKLHSRIGKKVIKHKATSHFRSRPITIDLCRIRSKYRDVKGCWCWFSAAPPFVDIFAPETPQRPCEEDGLFRCRRTILRKPRCSQGHATAVGTCNSSCLVSWGWQEMETPLCIPPGNGTTPFGPWFILMAPY